MYTANNTPLGGADLEGLDVVGTFIGSVGGLVLEGVKVAVGAAQTRQEREVAARIARMQTQAGLQMSTTEGESAVKIAEQATAQTKILAAAEVAKAEAAVRAAEAQAAALTLASRQPVIPLSTMLPPTPEVKKGLPAWAWALIGIGGVGAVGGLAWFFIAKRGKG